MQARSQGGATPVPTAAGWAAHEGPTVAASETAATSIRKHSDTKQPPLLLVPRMLPRRATELGLIVPATFAAAGALMSSTTPLAIARRRARAQATASCSAADHIPPSNGVRHG